MATEAATLLYMNRVDVAWLAGLLEGEGCFTLLRPNRGNARPSLRVHVVMTDKDVVERAAALMGTKVSERKPPDSHMDGRPIVNRKLQYQTYADSARAESVMRKVRAHMGQRRGERIDELLAIKELSHR